MTLMEQVTDYLLARFQPESGDCSMEHCDVVKQFGITSFEDARELAELTDRIVSNVTAIDGNEIDLDALLEQTSAIAANLKFIEESNVNLGELAERTCDVVANLKVIEEEA